MKTIKGIPTFCLFALGLGAVCAQNSTLPSPNSLQAPAPAPVAEVTFAQLNPDADRLAREQELRAQDDAERQKSLLRLEQELLEKQRKERTRATGLDTPAPAPLLLAQQTPVAPPPALPIAPTTPAGPMTPEQEAAARALLRQTGAQAVPAAPSPDWPRSKELGRGYAPNVQPSFGQGTRTVVVPPGGATRPIVIPPGATPPPAVPVPPSVVTTPAFPTPPAVAPTLVLPATPTPAQAPITPDSETAARALLRQKMAELNAGAPIAPVATPLPAPPAPPLVPATPVVAAPPSVTIATPGAAMTPEQEAAARDVLRARMTEVFDKPKGAFNDADPRARAEQEKNLREASRVQMEAEAKRLAEQRRPAPPVVQPPTVVSAVPAVPAVPGLNEAERSAEAERAARMARIEAEMKKRGVEVPAPAPVAVPTLVTPIAPAGPLSSAQENQAREVLRQKMAELGSASASAPGIAPRPITPLPPPPAAPPPPALRTTIPAAPSNGLTGEQDAAARELLRKKMGEINAGAVPVARAPAAPAIPLTPPPAVPRTPAPVAVAPVVAGAPSGLTPEQEAAARQVLRAKYAEATPVLAAPVPPPAAPAPVAGLPTSAPGAAPGALDSATDARARELLRQKMSELAVAQPTPPIDRRKPEAPIASPSKDTLAPVLKPAVAAVPGAAAPSFPKTKQQRLSELLEAYKTDKISPADYHNERAKIIAEP